MVCGPGERRRSASVAGGSDAPGWVTAALGEDLIGVARLPWGFTNETWEATTPAGGRYAVTRMASLQAASFVLQAGPDIARRVAAVGLTMPAPIVESSSATEGVIVSRWLAGASAMDRLSGPEGAAAVGFAVGEARRRLDAVDIDGLDLDDTWANPAGLADAAAGWLERIAPDVRSAAIPTIRRRIESVASLAPPPRPSFVHGDLVPANLLLRDAEGAGDALLDLEAARIGDPSLDAAWFHWIVGYHHPALLPDAWRAFARGAGLDLHALPLVERLRAYPVLRILEILAGQGLQADHRRRWLLQLEAATARGDTF